MATLVQVEQERSSKRRFVSSRWLEYGLGILLVVGWIVFFFYVAGHAPGP